MSSDALGNLAKIGRIKAEPMNRAEIDRMLVMARKRLADSSYPQVSQEGRFTSVYNTQYMEPHLQHFDGTAIAVKIATLFFSLLATRLRGLPVCGECSTLHIRNAIWLNMKAFLKSKSQQLLSSGYLQKNYLLM